MTEHDSAPQWGARDDERIGLERAVVGTALLNPQQFSGLAEIIDPGMLRHAPARLVWDMLAQRIPAGEPTDYAALQLAMPDEDLKRIGGPPAFVTLGHHAVGDARWHAEQLQQLHMRERVAAQLRGALTRVEREQDLEGALADLADLEALASGTSSSNPTQARLTQLRAALVDAETIDSIPEPVPLIDGVLFMDSLAWLYGKPGSGKSFVALDWAGCIANGLPWQYRAVSRGKVLYLVAEGVSGIRRRVRAWEHAANLGMADVVFLPIAVQLLNGIDLQALVALVTEMQPVLVVVDTQARVTVGAEENSNGEMSKVVDAADRIRQASGACVLMVHHSGKNGLDMRGASAFEGAATSIIKVGKDNDRWVDVLCDKQKDVEDFPPIRLQMTPTLDSVVLTGSSQAAELAESTKTEEKILTAMREAFAYTTASAAQLVEVSGISRASVYRALTALTKRGQLINVGTEKVARYSLPGSARNGG